MTIFVTIIAVGLRLGSLDMQFNKHAEVLLQAMGGNVGECYSLTCFREERVSHYF